MEGNACKICTYNFMHIFVMDTIQKKKIKNILKICMYFSDKQMSYFCIYALCTVLLNTTKMSQTTLKHGLHTYIKF